MDRWGILVLAHGSKTARWVEEIDRAVDPLRGWPVEVGFLDMVKGRDVAGAVRRLEQKGAEEVVVLPLFVSSGSTHLAELKSVLGEDGSGEPSSSLKLVRHRLRMHWAPPLDDHPLVMAILEERAKALSVVPEQETVLLVAHGSDREGFRAEWESMLRRMCLGLKRKAGFRDVAFATVHPNTVRPQARQLAGKGPLIVIPLFISPGYYTDTYIPAQLEGLACRYTGQTYLPHPLISRWLSGQVSHWVNQGPLHGDK